MANTQGNYQLYKRYVKNIALIYNKRKDVQTYVEMMLSISVIVIFGLFAIRPTFVTIGELRNEIKAKEDTLALLDKKVSDLDQAQRVWNQNRNLVALIDTAVPNGPLPVSFARQIEGVSRKNNTDLTTVSTEKVQILGESNEISEDEVDLDEARKTDRYPSTASNLNFNFRTQGSYANIISMITDIERLRRPIFIDQLKIETQDGENTDILLSISGRVPYVK